MLGQLIVGQLLEPDAELLGHLDGSAGGLMGITKRNTLAHQPFGDIGGERVAGGSQCCHPLDVERQTAHQSGHRRQQQLQLRHRVEHRFLVLLQVPVVGQRLSLERREQPGQVPDQPAGLAASQLGDVGVLLLRHDRAAGRPRVVQGDVAEFG